MNLTAEQKQRADRIDVRAEGKWWTRYETQKAKSIYPGSDPAYGDVTQQYMGNCFFLASILAIVLKANGAKHIKDHLLDPGDEWVFGKLYDGGDKPHIMKARKQYCSQSDGAGGTKRTEASALWVSMLAVYGSAFLIYKDKPEDVLYESRNPSLTRLNNGYARSALKLLSGKTATKGLLSTGWYTEMSAKHTAGYPIVINSKRAADLQQLFPGAGGAALNHVTIKGIVGGHSYAVWDVGTKQFGTAGPGNPPVDAIRVLNPWGRYKQNYTAVPTSTSNNYSWQTVDVAGQGDFWVPAQIVPKFFAAYYYAELALGNAIA